MWKGQADWPWHEEFCLANRGGNENRHVDRVMQRECYKGGGDTSASVGGREVRKGKATSSRALKMDRIGDECI
jgi:hypothetical protein